MPPKSNNFESAIGQAWPRASWREHHVVVAVSGGPDSVALLCGLASLARDDEQSAGQLIVAHFNHRWRGDDSDADERFVAELAKSYGLRFVCDRASDANSPNTDSSDTNSLNTDSPGKDSQSNMGSGAESLARDQRYAFLQRAAHECGARYIATAHNRNDQIETILHRILRGTGINGLRGIPVIRSLGDGVTIVRPMLSIAGNTIHNYLERIDQPFRVDASNEDSNFTRNKIRNEILPYLRNTLGTQLDQNILKLGHHADATHAIINEQCEILADRAVKLESNATIAVDCELLKDQPPHLICELFRNIWSDQEWPQRDMDAGRWQKLAQMVADPANDPAKSTEDSLTLPGKIVAQKDRNLIRLRRMK